MKVPLEAVSTPLPNGSVVGGSVVVWVVVSMVGCVVGTSSAEKYETC